MLNWVEHSQHCKEFLKKGYCIVPVKNLTALEKARSILVSVLKKDYNTLYKFDDESYLNNFHKFADTTKLNEVRIKIYNEVGANEEFRKLIFDCVQEYLFDLIGNEVVMQRRVNFVVHTPRDPNALIYVHTDSLAGDSPYEVVLWIPFVRVYESKSMYICSKEKNTVHLSDLMKGKKLKSATELLEKIRSDVERVSMNFGEALLFSPTLLHGSEENLTDETRFILNVRFKSLFSPYGTKALGETFVPVNYRPATEIGLNYEAEFGIVDGRE